MASATYIQTTVLPGGKIEIVSPELAEGQQANVFVVIEDDLHKPKRRLTEILKDYPGGRLFKSAAEVDAYIREERDAWER
jgi:hypothetical protein